METHVSKKLAAPIRVRPFTGIKQKQKQMTFDEIEKLKGVAKLSIMLWMGGMPPEQEDETVVVVNTVWRMVINKTNEEHPFALERATKEGFEIIGCYSTEEKIFEGFRQHSGLAEVNHYKDGMDETNITMRQILEKKVYQCGVFETQADAIVQMAITEINKDLSVQEVLSKIQWDRKNDMPLFMYNLWFNVVKVQAVKWAEHCIPQAWWLPVFYPAERQKEMGLID
jgi:hypothetical protein